MTTCLNISFSDEFKAGLFTELTDMDAMLVATDSVLQDLSQRNPDADAVRLSLIGKWRSVKQKVLEMAEIDSS